MDLRQLRYPMAAIAALSIAALMLSGCLGLAVGTGAVAASAAAQDRGISGTTSDTVIRSQINDLWFGYSTELHERVSLSVQDGRVLLIGKVPTQEMRLDAVRLAWKAQGVQEVINEIQVTTEGGIASYARDTWISTQLKTQILFDRRVASLNYSIETVNGVVYLMGLAQTKAELSRVTNYARNLQYVRRVVSYVQVKGAPSPQKS